MRTIEINDAELIQHLQTVYQRSKTKMSFPEFIVELVKLALPELERKVDFAPFAKRESESRSLS